MSVQHGAQRFALWAAECVQSGGWAAPLCYPKDVTAEMVQAWREAHPEE